MGLIKLTAQHTPYHAYSESGNSLFNTGVSERPNSWISIAILKNFSVCFSLSCFLVLISCLYVQICPLLLQSFAWEHVYFVKRRDQHLISLLCHADCRTSLTCKAKANQNWHSGLTLNLKVQMSITEKCVALLGISLSRVLGSGTMGALGMTGRFTACESCTIGQPWEGGAFLTGKMGVLHGESGHGIITPLSFSVLNTGTMPSIASLLSGYCLW